jgi:hypothetical protein
MSDFYVEFEIADEDRFRHLEAVVAALAEAKRIDDFGVDEYWLRFFDTEARSHFWQPTEEQKQDWLRRWQSTPLEQRSSDPSLVELPWDFGSMIDAFKNGDYELLGCRRVSERVGRIEFEPFGWPYGGAGCMRALIEAFGYRVISEPEN